MADIARREARNTPIVIHASGFDLVRRGLVASLARPGGNITGSQNLQSDTHGKRLQLLRECVPKLSRVAFLRESVTLTDVEAEARQEREYVDTAGPPRPGSPCLSRGSPRGFPRPVSRNGQEGHPWGVSNCDALHVRAPNTDRRSRGEASNCHNPYAQRVCRRGRPHVLWQQGLC